MSKLDKMMIDDGWELKSYKNCGVTYFAFHKNGFEVREEDIGDIDSLRDWKDEELKE